MQRLGEAIGKKRFAVLGGLTLQECRNKWHKKYKLGEGVVWGSYGPMDKRPEGAPEIERQDGPEYLARHLDLVGVPDAISTAIRAGLKDSWATSLTRIWFEGDKQFLLLHGESGAGKTTAACSVFAKVKSTLAWESGGRTSFDSASCRFETADGLARLGYFSDEAKGLLDQLGKVKWLVLDDLGAEMASESWRATLDSLINERHGRRECRTIITTNLSAKRPSTEQPSAFESRYGARLARRIRDSGDVVVSKFDTRTGADR